MTASHRLSKLVRHIRKEGVRSTIHAVGGAGRRTVADILEGTPGYYGLQRFYLERRYERSVFEPLSVDPTDIRYLTGTYDRRERGHLDYSPYFKPREANWGSVNYRGEVPYGTVRGGDWDRERSAFSNLRVYQGAQQRFVEGLEWEATAYYAELFDQLKQRGFEEKHARERTKKRCNKLQRLYDRIDSDGYQSQRERNGNPRHEVTVTISREGELLYNCEGRHRLVVAKLLDIDSIPVLVLVRHAEFDGSIAALTVETEEPRGEP